MPTRRISETGTKAVGLAGMDFRQVRKLLAASYWVPGISLARVKKLAANSFLVGAIIAADKTVLAYGRVVSDGSRMAYLADIVVHPDYRGQGWGKKMVAALVGHPALSEVDLWMLLTKDAHGLYRPFGFHALENPERLMVKRRRDAP